MNQPPDTSDISASLENLPSPPFVALEIIRLTRDPDSDAADLAAVLSNDPVLATRILQIANSPTYGLSRQVSSVERATALLGLKAVKMMALSFSLASDLDGSAGALAIETYWYHSLLNAVAARRWAELTAPGLAEEAFLAGLLSHLGRLVLAREKSDAYSELLVQTKSAWPTHAAEAAVFGFSSADLTAVLLRQWGLPSIVIEASGAMYCGRPPGAEVNGAQELAVVLEGVVAIERLLSGRAAEADVEAFHTAVAELGVPAEDADAFVVELEGRIRSMADMLDVHIPAGTSHQKVLDEARSRLVAVSLEAAQSLHSVELQADELRASNAELESMAYRDRLTGVPNRAAFDDHLSRTVAGAVRRDGGSVGLIMFDIDHFKSFNDTYGHQLGDEVLRMVAKAMASVTRGDELFARYGGEEFCLVAIDCSVADLFISGERLRKAVEQLRVPSECGDLAVTVSAGAAMLDRVHDRDAVTRVTKLADEALYEAKHNGRNQVQVAG